MVSAAVKHRQRGASIYELTGWSPPKLHEGKCWFVDFVCWDPATQRMKRKKYHIDNLPRLRDRRRRAAEIICNLTRRLQSGWNPWVDSGALGCYSHYLVVSEAYGRYVERMYQAKQIKRWTYLDWMSYHRNFDRWLQAVSVPVMYVYQVDTRLVVEFLDFLLLEKGVGVQTRNNYRAWLYQYCEWLMGRGYLAENPVKGTKKLRPGEKLRDAFTAEQLRALKAYLEPRNKHFLLACLMEYYCFIRPIEMVQLRVSFVDVRKRQLFVPGTISKNKRDYMVGLNDAVLGLMVELGVLSVPGDWFLFGRNFRPSAVEADGRIFRDYFVKVRRAMGWPLSLQFYSLKDAGIRDLANAEGIVVARDQARHADIETTNRYLKQHALTAQEATKRFRGAL